jgi:hypothetical protein
MCLPLEEVAVQAGQKVLVKGDNSVMIVGDPRGILG